LELCKDRLEKMHTCVTQADRTLDLLNNIKLK
jgi:hypothetical protein